MKNSLESRPQAYKRITNGIRQYMNHTVGVMKLVQEAKRLEIWKEKWSSWQEYIEKEFGKTRQRAYELLEIASTIDEIESVNNSDGFNVRQSDIKTQRNKGILSNLNIRQARALSGLPPDKKAEVFHGAINAEGGKNPTPKTINGVRSAIVKDEPEVLLDAEDYPVPLKIKDEWLRADALASSQMKLCSDMKALLNKAEEAKDKIFNEINISEALADLSDVRFKWKLVKPFVVCTNCQGKVPETCEFCGDKDKGDGKGWVSEFRYRTVLPETKSIRKKSAPAMIEQTRKEMMRQ